MEVFRRARVGMRLAICFGLVLALLLCVALTGMWKMSQAQAHLTEITGINNPETALTVDMRLAVNHSGAKLRDMVLVSDEAEHSRLSEELQQIRANYTAAEAKLATLLGGAAGTTAAERALFDRIQAHKSVARPIADRAIRLGLGNQNAEAMKVIVNELKPAYATWLKSLDELAALEAQLNVQAAREAESDFEGARRVMIGLSVLALVVAAAAAWGVTRSITRQLGGEPDYAQAVVREIASGNLAVEVRLQAGDAGSLLFDMKGMRDSLAHLVSQVRQGTDSIATGSSQIASGNADLSQRTEQQASNLQQTAASMEQMSATVRQNADTAQAATQVAAAASTAAGVGGERVGRVVATMSEIAESSKRIADIIGVIDGIAFQTNILALNAAVEAARAGEQGRGFAVVASEVRSLAQRSATAAREIKTLIGQSVEKVEAGSRLVGEAGSAMGGIVLQVRQVADMIGEISAATLEQTQGIGQVSAAVSQLDQVTQQNAALVEESAAAAESLKHQAGRLAEMVRVFRLDAHAAA